VNEGLLKKLENILNGYFQTDEPLTIGLSTAASCTADLNLSTGYFGVLIKKETGRSAQEYIHAKINEVAKEKIYDHSKSVDQIEYELGFKYPQHFTRLFKQKNGQTPNE
jgi:AraC family transcriptional regulator, transcriptional activator of pobA